MRKVGQESSNGFHNAGTGHSGFMEMNYTVEDEDWRKFLHERKEADISAIIEEERLKPEETRRFIDNALRDGMLKTTGTAIDKIMPPVSRFGGGRAAKKQGIIEKLMLFFEKYLGLI